MSATVVADFQSDGLPKTRSSPAPEVLRRLRLARKIGDAATGFASLVLQRTRETALVMLLVRLYTLYFVPTL